MQLVEPMPSTSNTMVFGNSVNVGPHVLRLFGALTFEGAEQKQSRFPTKRAALLLARLAVAKNQRIGRDELAEFLWPDDYLDLTRIRLRQELRRLRQSLGDVGNCIRADRQWVEIAPGCLTTDVVSFDEAIVASAVASDTDARAEWLTKAVQLLNGPFLAGFQDPWVHATRRNYDERARRAWLALADARQSMGAYEAALDATINAVRHDPLDTDANSTLIRRLIERGQGARAKQAFIEFDAMMFRELGCHAPASVRASIGSLQSERLEEASASESEVGKSFPRPCELFGRDTLLDAVQTSLARPGACLLLVGTVGVGKTHLLREAAWRFSRSCDIPVQCGGTPSRTSDGLYLIDASLDRRTLSETIEAARRNGWRVLAESRSRLESNGITEILVNPLAVPLPGDDAVTILENDAVRLLLSQVAGVVSATLNPTAAQKLGELARKLDGLPSVLRAMSSRLTIQTPDQVLRNLDEELHSLVAEMKCGDTTIAMELETLVVDLPPATVNAFIALSILEGASLDLATRLSEAFGDTDSWRTLERRSLITVSDFNGVRRCRVPKPIAIAAEHLRTAPIVAETWNTLADWAFEHSRQMTGAGQEHAFTCVEAEIENIRLGIQWSFQNDPKLAAVFAGATWRTVCARGVPSEDGDLLLKAAEVGAELLEPSLGGEAWTGAAITMSVVGRLEDAERAYCNGLRVFEEANLDYGIAWTNLNYAVRVLAKNDIQHAMERLLICAGKAENGNLRTLALSDYASLLAQVGRIDEAVKVAEDVFAARLQSSDITAQARAFVDLGDLYYLSGRPEAAKPLICEGIRRLREAGIQDMLLDQLIYLSEIVLADETGECDAVGALLEEARSIANKVGSKIKQIKIAMVHMAWASRMGDRLALVTAIDSAFQWARTSGSPTDRETALRHLAGLLEKHGKLSHANAIRATLGEKGLLPLNSGWQAILSTNSHETICVLAVVLAKEALLEG